LRDVEFPMQEASETTIGRNDDGAFGERRMQGRIHKRNGSRALPALALQYLPPAKVRRGGLPQIASVIAGRRL
jgi:hypothetical protein